MTCLDNSKGGICDKCKKPKTISKALIRTHLVCRKCYGELKLDNVKRIKGGIAITDSLDLLE